MLNQRSALARLLLAGVCLLATTALAACGGSSDGGSAGGDGNSATIYSSLPLQGASKGQTGAMVQGIELALEEAGGKAGGMKIEYKSLDDSTAEAGEWTPEQAAANAREVVQDSSAIALLGEYNSPASAISIPILNQAEMAEISPSSTYVGLTLGGPGTTSGEPEKYYPSGKRTFVRLIPNDAVQAGGLLTAAKEAGCTKIAVANDQESYGVGLAELMEEKQSDAGVNIVSNSGLSSAPNYRAYASKIKSEGADCFIFAGITERGAAQVLKDVHSALPEAALFAGDGACSTDLTDPSEGGLPAEVGSKYHCTIGALDLEAYPGGKQFLSGFKKKYDNAHPDPFAIFGYTAMQLALHTIDEGGTSRASFLEKLFNTKDYKSTLGPISIKSSGDTTLSEFGLYKVGADGAPEFEKPVAGEAGE